jgi:hypothetical protein
LRKGLLTGTRFTVARLADTERLVDFALYPIVDHEAHVLFLLTLGRPCE